MTRINCGIEPKELCDQHLLAEHREIKRIPNQIRKGKCNFDGIPETFTLGNGHVKFFYNKLGYLLDRYVSLYEECKKRGFNVTCYADAWDGIPDNLMMCYSPNDNDRRIVRARISDRIALMNKISYTEYVTFQKETTFSDNEH